MFRVVVENWTSFSKMGFPSSAEGEQKEPLKAHPAVV